MASSIRPPPCVFREDFRGFGVLAIDRELPTRLEPRLRMVRPACIERRETLAHRVEVVACGVDRGLKRKRLGKIRHRRTGLLNQGRRRIGIVSKERRPRVDEVCERMLGIERAQRLRGVLRGAEVESIDRGAAEERPRFGEPGMQAERLLERRGGLGGVVLVKQQVRLGEAASPVEPIEFAASAGEHRHQCLEPWRGAGIDAASHDQRLHEIRDRFRGVHGSVRLGKVGGVAIEFVESPEPIETGGSDPQGSRRVCLGQELERLLELAPAKGRLGTDLRRKRRVVQDRIEQPPFVEGGGRAAKRRVEILLEPQSMANPQIAAFFV